MPSVLDSAGNRPLLLCGHTGNPLWKDLPLVIDKALEKLGVGVVDVLDTLDRIPLAAGGIVPSLTKSPFHSHLIAIVAASHLYRSGF